MQFKKEALLKLSEAVAELCRFHFFFVSSLLKFSSFPSIHTRVLETVAKVVKQFSHL